MYKNLRDLLENAKGYSQLIIAVLIDIRGFTPFCQNVDSADVALFIKKVYTKIIDYYFPELEFYKPTGDGLLLVIPYGEENVKENCNKVVATCAKLLKDFSSICEEFPVINFEVPRFIGVGISRGSACCLKSGDTILDYSGKRLNLASRLMDIARPSGIVVDGDFKIELLEEDLRAQFKEEEVYVRGVAENTPITIHFMPQYTVITDSNKKPIRD